MMTVHEVSKRTGVSIRALHHYDKIGLLPATEVTAAGYRLYDDTALERLQYILLFKELEFPLKDIRDILDSADFNQEKALEQQIHLLELKKERLDALLDLARGIKKIGVKAMSFEAFDTKKIKRKDFPVTIEADSDVTNGTIVKLFDAVRKRGFSMVSLRTTERKQ